MKNINYLGHNFIFNDNDDVYKCSRCKIEMMIYLFDEDNPKYYFYNTYNENASINFNVNIINVMNCNEYIIKSIIE